MNIRYAAKTDIGRRQGFNEDSVRVVLALPANVVPRSTRTFSTPGHPAFVPT